MGREQSLSYTKTVTELTAVYTNNCCRCHGDYIHYIIIIYRKKKIKRETFVFFAHVCRINWFRTSLFGWVWEDYTTARESYIIRNYIQSDSPSTADHFFFFNNAVIL